MTTPTPRGLRKLETAVQLMLGLAVAMMVALFFAAPAQALVKQSGSGICHDEASAWFDRTRSFTAFGTMEDCLQSGRAYKGYSGVARPPAGASLEPAMGKVRPNAYDRALYDHWVDADGDCQNARHELLQELSTGPITLTSSGCAVARGRWLDPYTGQVFFEARDLDIDHMVPLAWAHAHGASEWTAEQRRAFANDPVNLFAVDAQANRAKGASGPLDWLPPNAAFRCEYVLRFHRVVLTYGLTYSDYERAGMDALRSRLCN